MRGSHSAMTADAPHISPAPLKRNRNIAGRVSMHSLCYRNGICSQAEHDV